MLEKVNKWDIRFLKLAKEISTWSLDPSSKIGCVAVGKNKNVIATGYNGHPRGIKDTAFRLDNREEKYKYVVHGEMNTLFNACQNGVSLENSTLYIYGLPLCSECAKGIIQVGIKRVVMSYNTSNEKWIKSFELTRDMLSECNIEYEIINV